MAARSTRITLRNETGQVLTHVSDSLSGGEWTDPLTPPASIAPGAVVWWQSESDGIATGTEGRAAYRIGDSGDQLDVHWDNPYVGTNFYEQGISGPYGLYFEGGKGDNTEVVYTLMSDQRFAVPGYLPSIHGYRFGNHWPDIHITSISLPDPFGDIPIGNASWGLCGGMSFASRDYFEAGRPAPVQSVNPRGEGDPLFDYIVRRLAQSLNAGDVADFVKYADPVYPDTDDLTGDGRNWRMAHVSWPGIRSVIDGGHPCPIGIVIGHLPDVTDMGHQVCVYAYQLRNQQLTLWVYDPNTPKNDDVTIQLDISRTDQQLIPVTTGISVHQSHPTINCFFTQSYEQREPPLTLTSDSQSALGAVARDPDQLDVFWVGPDGAIGSMWWNAAPGQNWGDHQPFAVTGPGAGVAGGRVASVSRDPNQMDVFWVGPDGAIGSMWWNAAPGQSWSDHQPFPVTGPGVARAGSPVAALSRNAHHMDVFWIGPDGAITSTWWDGAPGQNWSDHQPFAISGPNAAGPGSGLSAVSRDPNQMDVFWVGPDGAIGSMWWNAAPGQNWGDHQPFPITGPGAAQPGSAVASTSRSADQMDVFWVGPDGAIGSMWWNAAPGQNWSDHQPFPVTEPGVARAGSPVTALSRNAHHMDVFWIGPDGAITSTWWDGAPGQNWSDHQPFAISGPGASGPGSHLSAVARTPDHMDLFWIGPDGAVASTWWDSAPGSNWGDHTPFPITPPRAAIGPGSRPGTPSGLAVARDPDQLDVFWVGPDGAIGSMWWNAAPGQNWGDHQPFAVTGPGAGVAGGRVASVSRDPNQMDVFWVGPDGAIGSMWWNAAPGQSWSDHQPFPVTGPGVARAGSPVAALSRNAHHMDVFWIGPDGAITSTWWDGAPGQNWSDHQPFAISGPNAAGPGSGLSAVSRDPNQMDVFWVGPDGAIGSMWWNAAPGQNWGDHQPFPITGPGAAQPGSAVASTSRSADQMDVFWVGPDGAIGSMWWNAAPGQNWSDHQPFPVTEPGVARAGSPVTALSRNAHHMDVFWIGPDGAITSTWWDGAPGQNWSDHQPFAISGPGASGPGSHLSAVARTPDHMDLFWIGPDGAVASTWWDSAPGSNWGDHTPFPITPPRAGS